MVKKKRLRRGAGIAAGTALACCLAGSLLPATAMAKVDGSTYEVEVHATDGDASLTDGKDISTTTGYGLGVDAKSGHTAMVTVGNVTSSDTGRTVYAESRSGGVADLTLGNVTSNSGSDSSYVRTLSAHAYGGETTIVAGDITNNVPEYHAGVMFASSYGLYGGSTGDSSSRGNLNIKAGNVTSADQGLNLSASGENAETSLMLGNVSAASWNNLSASGGGYLMAGLGDVSSEKQDGLNLKAAREGFTFAKTGKISGANKALSISAYGGNSFVVAETKDLTSTGDSHESAGVYAQGGSSKNDDFVMLNVTGNVSASGTGMVLGQGGKYLVDGDVTSETSDGVSLGERDGDTAVLVTGTIDAGRNGINGLSSADVREKAHLTVWRIKAGENVFNGDENDEFAKKTNYIVKVREDQQDLITVEKSDGTPLEDDYDFGFDVAHYGDRLYVSASTDEECKKYAIYNGEGNDKEELPEDDKGYYLDVQKEGGIYLSAELADDHDWQFDELRWTAGDEDTGFTKAQASYTCRTNNAHTTTADADVTPEVTDPTCTEEGFTTYKATVSADVSPDGKEHSITATGKTSKAAGHAWRFDTFAWSEDSATGKPIAAARFVCENDGTHEKYAEAVISEEVTEPGCEEKGFTRYTATVTADKSLDKEEHTDHKDTHETDATGHAWNFDGIVEWVDNDDGDYYAAAGQFTCANDETHVAFAKTFDVTSEVTEPTCEENGYTTFTATISENDSPDGKKHSGSKKGLHKRPKGHKWGLKWKWSGNPHKGYTGADAEFTCENDQSHTMTVKANVTTEVTDPACDSKGFTTYTAKVSATESPDGNEYTDEVTGLYTDSIAHDWKFTEFLMSKDSLTEKPMAFARYVCDKGSTEHDKYVDAEVSTKVVEPACDKKGYTAAVLSISAENSLDGKAHSDEKHTDEKDPLGHDMTNVPKKATTCTEDGVVEGYFVCGRCGKWFWDSEGKQEISDHSAVVEPATGHNWGAWTVVRPATETEEGQEERVCGNDKDHKETRKIAPLTHEHGLTKVEKKDPTCTEDGNIEYYICNKGTNPCGGIFADAEGKNKISKEDTVIKADGHVLTGAIRENEVPATCEKEGSYDEVISCTVCGEVISRKTKTVPALGHDWGTWTVIKEATVDEEGEETRTCKRDGAHTETRAIPKKDHEHVAGVVTRDNEVAATCYDEGSYDEVVNCTICGTELSRVTKTVPALGHDWGETVYTWADDNSKVTAIRYCKRPAPSVHVDQETVETKAEVKAEPTCTEKGMTVYTAEFDNKDFETQTKTVETAALGHEWSDWTVTTPATCMKTGIETRTCKHDETHTETKESPVDKEAHDWGMWEVTEPATCMKTGIEIRICKNDPEHIEKKDIGIDLESHEWGDWIVIMEPTDTEDGLRKRTCKSNPEHTETEVIPKKASDHKITYDLAGGTLDGKTGTITEEYKYGTEITIAAAPARDGYKFLYWEGSQYNPGDKYTVTGDHTFKAVWQKVSTPVVTPEKKQSGSSNVTPAVRTVTTAPVSGGSVVKAAPQTGDTNLTGIWIAISVAAAAAAVGAVVYRRKKE